MLAITILVLYLCTCNCFTFKSSATYYKAQVLKMNFFDFFGKSNNNLALYLPESVRQKLTPEELLEISNMKTDGLSDMSNILDPVQFSNIFKQVNDLTDSSSSSMQSNFVSGFMHQLEKIAASPFTTPSALLAVLLMVVGGFGQDDSAVASSYAPGITQVYNVTLYEEFYGSRPLFVFRRLMKLLSVTAAFNIKLLLDWKSGNLQKNEPQRAKDLLQVISQLGPTFIKLGQALSIRTDLIPKAYAVELRQLQDKIPPFDNNLAKEIMRQQLKVKDLSEVFSKISDQPIASASIGQVYRATLKDGREVAVKVQRPGILDEIALDLYLLRLFTPIQTKLTNVISRRVTTPGDIENALALVDEWGRGFVAEVDYKLEALNTRKFLDAMISRKLDSVTAPRIVDEWSTSRVIVSEWIEGTRLDLDKNPDVPRLCGVAVNAYLSMLLDTGVLHCDPHLGNLLRTKDGKLCILDWGMTLEVPKDLQYSILELIAHTYIEDYDSIPSDFVNLKFTPPGKLKELEESGITEGISFVFRQLSKGGGPTQMSERLKDEFKKRYGEGLSDEEFRKAAQQEMADKFKMQLSNDGVDVKQVTDVMEEMSKRNRELFRLPPYILYVTRAFSVLEGIGLSIDKDYSILSECYPYLANRLFTDNSPRAKAALRLMLVGKDGEVFSPSKLAEMTENFSTYRVATAPLEETTSQTSSDYNPETGDTANMQHHVNTKSSDSQPEIALAKILLSPEGNFVQDILLESTAKTADALFRGGVQRVFGSRPGRVMKNIVKANINIAKRVTPKPFRALLAPLTLPYDVLNAMKDLLEREEVDDSVLQVMAGLSDIAGPNSAAVGDDGVSLDSADHKKLNSRQVARLLMVELTKPKSTLRKVLSDPEIRSLLPSSAKNISRKLLVNILHRASDRIDSTVEAKTERDTVVITGSLTKGTLQRLANILE